MDQKGRSSEDDDDLDGDVTPPPSIELKPRKRTVLSKGEERNVPKDKLIKFKNKDYTLPPILLLDQLKKHKLDSDEHVMEKANILKETLEQFKITAEVVGLEKGPSVTMYELELAPGTKVGKIINLSDDIAIALKAASIRVVAPIPGKSTIGIEVPNTHRKPVQMRELYETASKDISQTYNTITIG